MTCSLIIATYNWPEALELVLKSVKNQVQLPTEVLIADDGSREVTKELIKKYQKDYPIPLVHVWHEDDGFRKTIILNEAIRQSKGDYIIQMDGDCVCHPYYVKDHMDFARQGYYTQGSRVFMDESRSEQALKSFNFRIPFYGKGIVNRFNAMHIPFIRKLMGSPKESMSDARGCNQAFWKKDLELVNGYNEDMTGWGREDSELIARFMNNGILKRKLKFGAILYHVYHPEASRARLNKNDFILQEVIEQKRKRCKNGLVKS